MPALPLAERRLGECVLALVEGDITKVPADAIVNAANSRLAGGGGVDGAIHRAGGPSILEECRAHGGCPTGEAVATGAGRLPARVVVHAVGPVWNGGRDGEAALLASACRRALEVADESGAASVTLPALSTGAYGYPLEEAARVALATVGDVLARPPRHVRRVTFVLFGRAAFDVFARTLAALVREDVARSYEAVSAEYVRRIHGELAGKPFDRELLERFAATVEGPVCDAGSGPGHVAAFLAERGLAKTFCLDLAPAMLRHARALHPALPAVAGDMTALPLAGGTLGGVLAFYSVLNLPRAEVVSALAEFRRVLAPGGRLLLAFHLGGETVELTSWWETPVRVGFCFFEVEEMRGYLAEAGFAIEQLVTREPYPDVEHPSRRAYVLARPLPRPAP